MTKFVVDQLVKYKNKPALVTGAKGGNYDIFLNDEIISVKEADLKKNNEVLKANRKVLYRRGTVGQFATILKKYGDKFDIQLESGLILENVEVDNISALNKPVVIKFNNSSPVKKDEVYRIYTRMRMNNISCGKIQKIIDADKYEQLEKKFIKDHPTYEECDFDVFYTPDTSPETRHKRSSPKGRKGSKSPKRSPKGSKSPKRSPKVQKLDLMNEVKRGTKLNKPKQASKPNLMDEIKRGTKLNKRSSPKSPPKRIIGPNLMDEIKRGAKLKSHVVQKKSPIKKKGMDNIFENAIEKAMRGRRKHIDSDSSDSEDSDWN